MKSLTLLQIKVKAFCWIPAILLASVVLALLWGIIALFGMDFEESVKFHSISFLSFPVILALTREALAKRVPLFECFTPPRIIRKRDCVKPHSTLQFHHYVYRFMSEYSTYKLYDWMQLKKLEETSKSE